MNQREESEGKRESCLGKGEWFNFVWVKAQVIWYRVRIELIKGASLKNQCFIQKGRAILIVSGTEIWYRKWFSSVQFSWSVMSDSCNPMNHSTPGLPVHHQFPEFTQTHVHWVGDAIQSPHPLLSPSPPAFKLSQHQGLFKWVSSLHQVAKILEFQLQHQSFQWTPRTDIL